MCLPIHSAKGRTNIELREQFILADGVSQSMAAFTPRRSISNAVQNGSNNSNGNLPPYMSGQGPIIKVNKYSFHSFKRVSVAQNCIPIFLLTRFPCKVSAYGQVEFKLFFNFK